MVRAVCFCGNFGRCVTNGLVIGLFANIFFATQRKIKAVFASRAQSGKPITSQPPYGFVKDPNDKNKWLVDTEAAAVVNRIYQMTIDGIGIGKIAWILSEEKIDRPSYYLGSRGIGLHKNNYDVEHRYAWGTATIKNILNHLEYCGHTVNLRTTVQNFKTKKSKKKPEEDWLIFENTHRPLLILIQFIPQEKTA